MPRIKNLAVKKIYMAEVNVDGLVYLDYCQNDHHQSSWAPVRTTYCFLKLRRLYYALMFIFFQSTDYLFRSGFRKLWPTGQIWPAAVFIQLMS